MCQCKPESTFIKNSNQMEFPGFETRPNLKNAYDSGYDTGINWDANWMPGGPFILHNNDTSRLEHDQWHIGFHEGLVTRLVENKHFATWWNRNKGKGLTSSKVKPDEVRYIAPEQNNSEN